MTSARLDTHVVAWLYAGMVDRLSEHAVAVIESSDLRISPMVELELTYLHEIGRLAVGGRPIVADLEERIGLRVSEQPFAAVVREAAALSWTRDPFDRLIAADAIVESAPLLTKDTALRTHVALAAW